MVLLLQYPRSHCEPPLFFAAKGSPQKILQVWYTPSSLSCWVFSLAPVWLSFYCSVITVWILLSVLQSVFSWPILPLFSRGLRSFRASRLFFSTIDAGLRDCRWIRRSRRSQKLICPMTHWPLLIVRLPANQTFYLWLLLRPCIFYWVYFCSFSLFCRD